MSIFEPREHVLPNLLSVHIPGKRVVLIPLSRKHAPDILREFTVEITRYMLPKPTEELDQANNFIDTSRENMAAGSELVLAITRMGDGEFLGVCGLHGKEHSNTPELGVWIKKSAHGARLGREAVHTLATWAQAHLKYSYLIYPVDKNNMPSRKIAESIGGTVFKEALRESQSGHVLNEVVYRIDVVSSRDEK